MPPVLDLPVLRVLDLEEYDDSWIVDHDGFFSLFHLRHLMFSRGMLPAQIGYQNFYPDCILSYFI